MKYLVLPFVLVLSACSGSEVIPAKEGNLLDYKTSGPDQYGVVCYQRISGTSISCVKVQ